MNKQALQVLNYLRTHDGMTTRDACAEFILSPAKRVQELRDEGYDIETVRKRTNSGRKCGVYVLHERSEVNA